jgi:hypothetical protein
LACNIANAKLQVNSYCYIFLWQAIKNPPKRVTMGFCCGVFMIAGVFSITEADLVAIESRHFPSDQVLALWRLEAHKVGYTERCRFFPARLLQAFALA